jgi:TolB-like protein
MRAVLISSTVLLIISFVCCSTSKEVETKYESETLREAETNNEIGNNIDDALNDLTNQIVTSLSEGKKSKIAVLEFVDLQGKVTDLGKFIAEELITRLYKTNRFQVIERQLLNKVLEEYKLTSTGIIDQSSAKQLGSILGIDAIASGTISDLGNSVKVNSRLFSTETGSIFSVASTEIYKDDSINKLLIGAIEKKKEIKDLPNQNISSFADITASSEYSAKYKAQNVADGIILVKNRGEWASRGQREGAFITLSWVNEMEVTRIILYDRPNPVDNIYQATILFSDDTSLRTGQLPNDGSAKEITFEPKLIKWLRFTVDSGDGPNVGLAELEVYGR